MIGHYRVSNQEHNDPYTYPGTDVLINKFNIRNANELSELEALTFQANQILPLPKGNLDYDHLKAIHKHYFGDVYEWAGKERTIDISKGGDLFGHVAFVSKELNKLFARFKQENFLQGLEQDVFCEHLSYYFNEINAAHPFREGNGRTQRAFCDAVAEQAGYKLNWEKVTRHSYLQASIDGFKGDYTAMEAVFKSISSSLSLNQNAELNIDTRQQLGEYLQKQVELSEVFKEKISALCNDELSREVNDRINQLDKSAKTLAASLLAREDVQKILKQDAAWLHERNNLDDVFKRHVQGNSTNQDVVSVLRYAQNSANNLSQKVSQEQSQDRGGRKR